MHTICKDSTQITSEIYFKGKWKRNYKLYVAGIKIRTQMNPQWNWDIKNNTDFYRF
jgi:hypothetical protein